MHIHKGGQLKDISEQHTWSVLGIDVPGVHYKHLGHILNVLHNVEELHAHHRELPEDVLPAIHHTTGSQTIPVSNLAATQHQQRCRN